MVWFLNFDGQEEHIWPDDDYYSNPGSQDEATQSAMRNYKTKVAEVGEGMLLVWSDSALKWAI